MSGVARKAGVIGWPVAHSLSPVMMGAWLEAAGLPGRYDRIEAAPGVFAETITRLQAEGYAGVNVTLPHKEAALALADTASPAARAVGAANVLIFENGAVRADNTDIIGVETALRGGGWQANGRPAVLIGAGGAARAAMHVLTAAGVPVRIVNRSQVRAQALSDAFSGTAELYPLDRAGAALESAGLVINATSLGMAGQQSLTLPLERLEADALVFDMVYVPLRTPLLVAAQARALKTADGLSMLIGQARPAFEAFFGGPPPVETPVRGLLEAPLETNG
jgi:shikimate dehydrogenase